LAPPSKKKQKTEAVVDLIDHSAYEGPEITNWKKIGYVQLNSDDR
jgi:hypothetical protein